jgi:hypothetical protein
LLIGPGNQGGSATGTIAGVHGTLTRASGAYASGIYTFAADSGTVTTACPANTPFIPDAMTACRDQILWIWLGTNSPNAAVDIPNIQGIVNLARPLFKRILIISAFNTSSTGSNSTGSSYASYQAVLALNAQLLTTFPEYFVTVPTVTPAGTVLKDCRQALVYWGIANYQQGTNQATAQDNADALNDIIPTSLRADGTHINSTVLPSKRL